MLLPRKPGLEDPLNLRVAEIWAKLNPDQQESAAVAFWSDPTLSVEHEEANQALAKNLRTRPKTVRGMPVDRKSRLMLLHAKQSEQVLMAMLVAFHLKFRRTMLTNFLGLLEIEHQDGFIPDFDKIERPTLERLRAAVGALGTQFPSLEILVYFACLIQQAPDFWGDLPALMGDLGKRLGARSE